jgi:hypothetical protein
MNIYSRMVSCSENVELSEKHLHHVGSEQVRPSDVLQEPQIQQAAALAGGSNVSASEPAIAAAVHSQLLHVVANEVADSIPAGQPSITAECLMVC